MVPLSIFRSLIDRKFRSIAGDRYEEIVKRYREFLLLPEEFVLPEVESILIPLDRFSGDFHGVLDVMDAYKGARVRLVYLLDAQTFRLIEETLGEEEAQKLLQAEKERGKGLVTALKESLEGFGLDVQIEERFGDKGDDVIEMASDYDLLVISRSFGSEVTKTSPLSPVVLKIVQHVLVPVIVY
ncbi:universal stress protein [Thermococcus sp.]